MGWRNCRPKSRAQCELRELFRREFFFAIDIVSSPLPMLLCSRDRRAAIEREKERGERLQAFHRGLEEAHGAAQRPAFRVVIRGGELNERSEERRVGKECRSRWS